MRLFGLTSRKRIEALENDNSGLRRDNSGLRRENGGLRQEIEQKDAEIARLEKSQERLQHERERLRQDRDRLTRELATARRARKRQAAPFSKGPPKRHPKRPGRKRGRAYGPKAHRPIGRGGRLPPATSRPSCSRAWR